MNERTIENPYQNEEQKRNFETVFGKNKEVRTRKQWKLLVNVYGLETVCKMEEMTEDEVNTICIETLSQRLARINRIRHTIQ